MKKYYYAIVLFFLFIILSWVSLFILDKSYPLKLTKLNDWSLQVVDSNNQLLRGFLSQDQKWRFKVTFKQLPSDYIKLLLNYEDRHFYQHHGVDFNAIVRALRQNLFSGHVVSGASTITMQLAKLLDPKPRTIKSKIIESFRAWQLERHFNKQQILAFYSSLIPMGGNIEGIVAASRYYFNKELNNLTLSELAWLIALPQSPNHHNALKNNAEALLARNKVLSRALEYGVISQSDYQQSINASLSVAPHPLPFLAPHYTRLLKSKLNSSNPIINYDIDQFMIHTQIDKLLQQQTEQLLKSQLFHRHPQENLVALIIDNKTGQPVVYVGADFFNEQRLGQVDLIQSIRSPGSALKPFIYLYAFDWLNYHPLTTVYDIPTRIGDYHPQNYDRTYHGEVTLAQALQLSLNIPAVKLLQQIGPDHFFKKVQQQGLKLYLPADAKPNLTMALGGVGIKAGELLQLYRQLANCSYQNEHQDDSVHKVTPTLAKSQSCWYVTHTLQQSADINGRIFWGAEPVAFKTGTSYGWRDQWVFAYTDRYSVMIWSGRADGRFAEAKSGSQSVVPILRSLVALLPNPPSQWFVEKPAWLFAINQQTRLPRQLKTIEAEQNINELKITSPLDHSKIELIKDELSSTMVYLPINLTVSGGKAPYLWIINDEMIAQTRENGYTWTDVTSGSYKIEVIDQSGSYAASQIEISEPTEEIIPKVTLIPN